MVQEDALQQALVQAALYFRPWIRNSWTTVLGDGSAILDFVATNGLWTQNLAMAETVIAVGEADPSDLKAALRPGQRLVWVTNFAGNLEGFERFEICDGKYLSSPLPIQGEGVASTPSDPSGHLPHLADGEGESIARFPRALVIGENLPQWPSVGISIPTIKPERAVNAALALQAAYPGKVNIAIVANGYSALNIPDFQGIHCIWEKDNLGYGQGANRGLAWLMENTDCELLAVSNDDVYPDIDCLAELVDVYQRLQTSGQKPGIVGPVSNSVSGAQQVSLEPYSSVDSMLSSAAKYRKPLLGQATAALQVRGLFFISPRKAIEEVGGFDPVYGLGNFEDDDLNVRMRLAGYSLWIAPGAYLHHDGSITFKELGIDYANSIAAGERTFCQKWGVETLDQGFRITAPPAGVGLKVPLAA